MSEAELVQTDPSLETAPDLSALGSTIEAPGTRAGQGSRGATHNVSLSGAWDHGLVVDLGSGLGGTAVRDAMRGYVNVPHDVQTKAGATERRRGTQGEVLGLAGVDIGPAANEWIQETVQNILNSALRLDFNEKGQTSFSILGLGDFSVDVSADRSEIALATGDTVLLAAQRPPIPASPGSSAGADWASGGSAGSFNGGGIGPLGDSPFRQAMELVLELAQHPLSFLVYGVIAVYGLIWAVLSRRNAAAMDRWSTATKLKSRPDMPPAVGLRSNPAGMRKHRGQRHRTKPSTHRA